jgi:DNA topoisomerase-1
VFEVGANRAVALLAEKAANRRPRGSSVLKELGDHPDEGGKVRILNGRYGPYVKHGKINATIPKDRDPEQVTLEEALELIAARAAKDPGKRSAKKVAKKTAAKKTAKKSARKRAPSEEVAEEAAS